ncbi:helix-turn-helix domain-containing protein [Streptomyces xanthochromogenes]|uniref:helix-turn-helix domain-containing protein n=1 Tax=Streptomyces xanthochromogenes TaxID=67384 RepID=UPI00342B2655
MEHEGQHEDFADLLKRLKLTYDVNESEIARALNIAPATVNAWVNRKRGTGRGPRPDTLRALADAFPRFTVAEIFAATGRKAPGPLAPEAEARLLELFRELTPEQQQMKEIEMKALRDANRA